MNGSSEQSAPLDPTTTPALTPMLAAAAAAAAAMRAQAQAPPLRPAAQPQRWDPATHLAHFDTFMFDCDGVLWQESAAIPGAADALRQLHNMGKLILFATNNSGKSREQNLAKFRQLGFDFGITTDHIFTSSQASAYYLSSGRDPRFDPAAHAVLAVGEAGIGLEMRRAGLQCVETMEIGAVVVGYDSELTYTKVAYALDVLSRVREAEPAGGADRDSESNRSAVFLSTNQDAIFPTAAHSLPGAGSCVAMVAATAGRAPVNIGKPQTVMLDLAVERWQLDKSRLLFVGDRLDTDIAFGRNGGVAAALVTTTGVHTLADVPKFGETPTFFLDSVAQLVAQQ